MIQSIILCFYRLSVVVMLTILRSLVCFCCCERCCERYCVRYCNVAVVKYAEYARVAASLRYLSSSDLVLGWVLIRFKVIHRAH